MADDITTLTIKVTSSGIDKANADLKGLGQAADSASKKTKGLPSDLDNTGNAARRASDGIKQLYGAMVAYGGLQAMRQIVETADAYSGLQARLALATGSAESASAAFADLNELTKRNHSDIQATAGLYTKLAMSTESLGLSHNELLTITETVGNAFRVSGASAGEMDSAIRQLGQGFASGALRGDEFNSMMENAPRLAQALADSLGVTRGELREIAADGQLTSEAMAKAFMEQSAAIQEEVGKIPVTAGQAMQDVRNAMFNALGPTATGELVDSIQGLSDALNDPAVAQGITAIASGMVRIATATAEAIAIFGRFGVALGETLARYIEGEDVLGSMEKKIAVLREAIDKAKKEGTTSFMGESVSQWEADLADLERRYNILLGNAVKAHQTIDNKPTGINASQSVLKGFGIGGKTQSASKVAMDESNEALQTASKNMEAEVAKRIDAEKRKVETVRTSHKEIEDLKRESAASALESVERELMTEEEAILQSYQRRKEIILANTVAGSDKQNALLSRNESEFIGQATGDFAEPVTFEDQLAKLQQEYQAKQEAYAGHEGAMTQITADYERQRAAIINQHNQARLANAASLFDGLAGITKQFAGEDSKAYKAMFAVSKGFQVAQALMEQSGAIMKAWNQPWPANLAAVGMVLGATMPVLASIKGASFSGAHDQGGQIGANQIGVVGERGMELVSGSANVLGRQQTANLLENASAAANGKPEVKVLVVNMLDKSELIEGLKNSSEFDEVIVNSIGRNKTATREAMG